MGMRSYPGVPHSAPFNPRPLLVWCPCLQEPVVATPADQQKGVRHLKQQLVQQWKQEQAAARQEAIRAAQEQRQLQQQQEQQRRQKRQEDLKRLLQEAKAARREQEALAAAKQVGTAWWFAPDLTLKCGQRRPKYVASTCNTLAAAVISILPSGTLCQLRKSTNRLSTAPPPPPLQP